MFRISQISFNLSIQTEAFIRFPKSERENHFDTEDKAFHLPFIASKAALVLGGRAPAPTTKLIDTIDGAGAP